MTAELSMRVPMQHEMAVLRKRVISLEKELRVLREQAVLWRELMDTTPVAVVVKDGQGQYLLLNQGAEHLLGLPQAAAVGLTDAELWAPELANVLRQDEAYAVHHQTLVQREVWVEQDGACQTMLACTFPVPNLVATMLGVVHVSCTLDPAQPCLMLCVLTEHAD